ncbi:MAG: hypothetical protein KAJ69_01590, partial [Thermoplasmatales archaeon]|nr:hypothetical protein [Thermoplasmatales archaeon]
MKSSTYASLVTIIFLKHKSKMSRSIESAIRTTDKFCKNLKLKNDLSHMTKYRIISDLLQSGILITRKTRKNKKL